MRWVIVWIFWIHAAAAGAQGAEDPSFDAEFGDDPTFPTEAQPEATQETQPDETPTETSENDDPTLEVVEDEDTHWLLSVGALVTAPIDDDWDDGLASRGYGEPSPSYGADLGVLYRATRWLNVGLRLAARHRYWLHWERPAATLFGTDVLLSLDARLSPGRVFQLGLHASGGLGLASVSLNGQRKLRALGRVQVGPLITIKLKGTLRAMVRMAYDHARVRLADDLDANLGGFTLLVGFEVRE